MHILFNIIFFLRIVSIISRRIILYFVSLFTMTTSSEDVLMQVSQVRYKKGDGTLYVMNERIAWMLDNRDTVSVSHKYGDIKCESLRNCINSELVLSLRNFCITKRYLTLIFLQRKKYHQRENQRFNCRWYYTTVHHLHFTL